MTFNTLSTIHDTLKNEYSRLCMQVRAADSACKNAYREMDDYRTKNPEIYKESLDRLATGQPASDPILNKLFKRWSDLTDIVRPLSVKAQKLEKALDEFENQSW